MSEPTQNEGSGNSAAAAMKPKLSPGESALSLLDFLQKMISESKETFTPVFEYSFELPKSEEEQEPKAPEVKHEQMETEAVKSEPTEVVTETQPAVEAERSDSNQSAKEKKRDGEKEIRKPDVQQKVTLKFVDQGKEYTKTGVNRAVLEDMVVREALQDLFQVSHEEITMIARRYATNRLGCDMKNFERLQTICCILNCKVTFNCEETENHMFVGNCRIVDLSDGGITFESKTDAVQSKALAKDHAAQEMLRKYYIIDSCEQSSIDEKHEIPVKMTYDELVMRVETLEVEKKCHYLEVENLAQAAEKLKLDKLILLKLLALERAKHRMACDSYIKKIKRILGNMQSEYADMNKEMEPLVTRSDLSEFQVKETDIDVAETAGYATQQIPTASTATVSSTSQPPLQQMTLSSGSSSPTQHKASVPSPKASNTANTKKAMSSQQTSEMMTQMKPGDPKMDK